MPPTRASMHPSEQQLLEQAAVGTPLDSNDWPRVLEFIATQLDSIATSEFPPPPPSSSRPADASVPKSSDPSSPESPTADKENAPPPNSIPNDILGPRRDQVSVTEMTAALRSSILNTLRSDFSAHPPYTIQRLAELILWPKREYRFLPPYLAAVNRVVSVSSNTSIFPLPQASLSQTGTLLNGISRLPEPALGSDESLGGALLTPIPWLIRNSPTSDAERDLQATAQRLQEQQGLGNNTEREPQLLSESTEMVQGPNGAGRVETVSVVNGGILSGGLPTLGSNSLLTAAGPAPSPSGNAQLATQPLGIGSPPSQNIEMTLRAEGAVTQGELLRLEQQAGIVPVPHRTSRLTADEVAMGSEDVAVEGVEGQDVPHARGPEEIGVEDTGLQTGQGGVEGLRAGSDRRSSNSPAAQGPAEHDVKASEDSEEGMSLS